MFTLKPISHDSVDGALAKAERYRLLNEPHEAETVSYTHLDVYKRQVRTEAAMVSELSALFSGAPHSMDPGPLPADVLLLSRRILQIVLGRSSRVRGKRCLLYTSRCV